MKLVIATLKELHEINRWGGGGEREKDTQKKIQNIEMCQMKTNMISRQLVFYHANYNKKIIIKVTG